MLDSLVKLLNEKYDGCDQCYKEWFDLLKSIEEDISEAGIQFLWVILKENGIEAVDVNNTVNHLKCSNCKQDLSIDSILISDIEEFHEYIVDLAADTLNQEIEGCTYCNTDKIPFTQKHDDPLNLSMGSDLMMEYSIPSALYSEIASKLECKCGTMLNLDDPYVTRFELDYWYGEDEVVEAVIKTFGIPESDVYAFTEYIYRHPMLGLKHEVGQLIFDAFKNRNVPGMVTMEKGKVFYRARKRNKISRMVPFIDDELWAPPLGISGHGRFNPVGVPVLYLANSPKTGMLEIELTNDIENMAEIGEFLLLKNMEIWNVRGTDISKHLAMPSLNRNNISREYLLPNFIAQCCTLTHINGILYDSVKNSSGYNLTLLNYVKDYDIGVYSVLERMNL